jgi:valyl-tRNA synthetase
LDQTRENRQLPRITCRKCSKEFSTQWAEKPDDKALPRGAVVSERFEIARNFTTKLWNAARFTLLNLHDYSAAPLQNSDLLLEDRWLLSRLETVTKLVTESLAAYHFADAARAVYDFAWDEFCSFYLEMVRSRLQNPEQRATAQRILAYALDKLLRLLHPIMPFITEEIWQMLNRAAPVRGLSEPEPSTDSIMIAPWPEADESRRDLGIESQFASFQKILTAVRDLRARQNIPSKAPLEFYVQCSDSVASMVQPLAGNFRGMANATPVAWGSQITPPATHAKIGLDDMELFVDLKEFIDVDAEIARNHQEQEKLLNLIKGKEAKLSNASFVQRAPADVVAKERETLAQYQDRLSSIRATIADLQRVQK